MSTEIRNTTCSPCAGAGFVGADEVCESCEGYGLLRDDDWNRCVAHDIKVRAARGCPLCNMARQQWYLEMQARRQKRKQLEAKS